MSVPVVSALDFALQLLAFAFHFLRFSFAAYFRVSALLLDFACSLVGCTFQLVFHFAHDIYLFLIYIGRPSCSEIVCQYVSFSVVAVSLNKNIITYYTFQPHTFH